MFASIHNLPPDELYHKAIIFKELSDYDNYIIYLTMAANLNHMLAIEYLYNDYRNDCIHKKQDYNKTINFYETSIEYGFSANYLGWMFQNGKGVSKDHNK